MQGQGRIDRIYCKKSCRTLAWRVRTGDRYEGRRKPRVSAQPGDFVARKALPLLAVRMKSELEAAKRRIAELEQQLSEQRDESMQDGDATPGVAAAVGVAALFAALRMRLNRRHRGELDRIRAASKMEREHHRTEMAAEKEQAARRETEHRQQVEALSLRVERAEQGAREAATSATQAHEIADGLRLRLDEAAKENLRQIDQLATFRTEYAKVRAANAHLEGILTTERRHFSARAGRLFDSIEEHGQKRLAQQEARLKRDQAAAPKTARHQRAEPLAINAATDGNSEGHPSILQLVAVPPQRLGQMALPPPETSEIEHQRAAPRKDREQSTTDDKLRARSKSATKRKKKRKKEPSKFGDSIAAAGRAVAGAVVSLVLVQGTSDHGGKRLNPKNEARRLESGSKK